MPIQNLEARARQAGQAIEDYSQQLTDALQQPIGSANIVVNGINSAVEGAASELNGAISSVTNVLNNPGAAIGDAIGGALSDAIGGALGGLLGGLGGLAFPVGIQENPLSKYASYNCIFTFGALSTYEVNFPDFTYRRTGKSNNVVLRSGGAGSSHTQTLYEKQLGIKGEYFIDNVEVDTIIAPNRRTKQTNATGISFEVLEPYSMGLFLQALQVAALRGGHKNYLQAPFLLTVEFIGWDDNGRPLNIPNTRRMFPLKLSNVEFNVTAEGSKYTVEAIAWHEQAFANEIQGVKTDVDIKGATVAELLQTGPESLATILNNREIQQQQAGNKTQADQYVILFPKSRSTQDEQLIGAVEQADGATTQSSTAANGMPARELSDERKQELYEQISGIENGEVPADFDAELSKILGIVVRRSNLGESIREYAEKEENLNRIGQSKIAKSYLDEGRQVFGRPAFVRDEETGEFSRGNITISDDGRRINFKQGAKVQDIIEEVVLLSEYGRQFATETPDSNGMKTWFRIESDVYSVTDSNNVDRTGQNPRVIVYRVVPYQVSASRLTSPTQAAPGMANLKRQAVKEYNYIYTGKNDDVLNFDIQIDTAFFNAVQADFGQLTRTSVTQGANTLAAPPAQPVFGQNDGNTNNIPSTGTAAASTVSNVNTGQQGGGVTNHPETQIARAFNDAIVNSNTDLVSANIEIWGDPYYIADSGMGNYNAPEIPGILNINPNGSIDYQSSEVDVLINFRTPIDIGADGMMDYPGAGTRPVGAFSGLYQVLTVKNKFSGNRFTQELETIRRRNQPTEGSVEAVTQDLEAVIEKGLDAIISPIASVPAAAFAQAEAALSQALGGTGGIASAATALEQASNELTGALNSAVPNIQREATNALNTARAAASSAANDLTNALRGN
jgi:hypothetical protein